MHVVEGRRGCRLSAAECHGHSRWKIEKECTSGSFRSRFAQSPTRSGGLRNFQQHHRLGHTVSLDCLYAAGARQTQKAHTDQHAVNLDALLCRTVIIMPGAKVK